MANQRPDLLARRLIRDMMIYTHGIKMSWVPLETLARRLMLKDGTATSAALALAETTSWLTVKNGHSLGLTDAGRHIAKH